MIALWQVGFLAEQCRTALQIGIGLALQSTLLLGLALLARWALRGRGPALRSLLYRATLAATLAGGLASLLAGRHLQPFWSVSLPRAAEQPAVPAARLGAIPLIPAVDPPANAAVTDPLALWRKAPLPGSGAAEAVSPSAPASGTRASGASQVAGGRTGLAPKRRSRSLEAPFGVLYVGLVVAWGAGALLLLSRLLLCQLHLHRLRQSCTPIEAPAAQRLLADLSCALWVSPPLLLAGRSVRSPLLTGFLRPAVLLPADYDQQFDAPTLRLIVTHELIHLARRDCAWNLLAWLVCALGWLQPLLWVLRRRLVQTSEEVCDQEVVRLDGNPRAYASCLLTLSERLLPSAPERALGVGMAPFRSSLGRRIQQIMDSQRQQSLPLSPRLRVLVALGAASAAALGLLLVSAGAAPPGGADRPLADNLGSPADELHGDVREQRRDVLKQVQALDKRVAYTETKIPLGELVQKVAADTGVALAAAADVADEPVVVVVKDLPARELLEQLAELLDYLWTRQGKEGAWRYEIWQDVPGKQREEALRQQAWAEVDKRLQAEIRRQIEAPALSPAEIKRRMQEEEEAGQKLGRFTSPEQRNAFLNSPQDRERRRRTGDAMRQFSPINLALTRFLGRLTPQQWTALRQGEPLRFSTNPQPGELPLPEAVAQTLRTSKPMEYPAGFRIYPDHPEIDAEIRQREKETQERWASATDYRVIVRIGPSPIAPQERTSPSLSLSVGAEVVRGGEPSEELARPREPGGGIEIRIGPLRGEEWAVENTPERTAALARDPALGARRLFKPAAKPQPAPGWGPDAIRVWRLRDLLPEVARTYGVNLIGDAYWSAPILTVARVSSGTPLPLYQLLDRLTAPKTHWERRGAVLRMRSRNWCFDRPREIPLRLVRRWAAMEEEQGALPLEEYLQMVASLREEQLESLELFHETAAFPPSISELVGAYWARHALRLYASLSPAQQQALWRGDAIPVAQMTPAQQAFYIQAVREQTRLQSKPPDPQRWASGLLTLRGVPMVRVRERRSAGVAERVELVTRSAGGRISTVATGSPDVQVLHLLPVEAAALARTAVTTAAAGMPPGGPAAAVARYPMMNLLFQWEYSPAAKQFSLVTIAVPR